MYLFLKLTLNPENMISIMCTLVVEGGGGGEVHVVWVQGALHMSFTNKILGNKWKG